MHYFKYSSGSDFENCTGQGSDSDSESTPDASTAGVSRGAVNSPKVVERARGPRDCLPN